MATTDIPAGPVRVAVVNSHPIQYAAPMYAWINRDPTLDITALYGSDFSLRGGRDEGFGQSVTWDVDLLSGYRSVFMGERAKTRSIHGFWSQVVPELWREIRSGRYDVVWLHGYGYASYVLAWIAAKSRGLPVLMRGETHLRLQRTPWRQKLRDGVLGFAFRRWVDRFLAIGSANRDYYRAMGVADSRIFLVPYTVDNDRFIASSQITVDERAALRREWGIPDDVPVVLFASKFTPRKHPECVLDAAALLRKRGIDVAVLMVGSGELETELREQVQRLGIERVHFTGFVNQSELPRVYAACDVFVLPSSNEPWGFIINEVMCAGLPLVVSDTVGSVPDLVHDGRNGRLMQEGDAASMADALADIVSDPGRAHAMGAQSLEIINAWSYEACRRGLRDAVASLPRAGERRS